MTAHEVLISLFWLVVLAYGLYLGWFARNALRDAKHKHRPTPHDSVPAELGDAHSDGVRRPNS
ncbi:MAG: hypothetical protein ACR2NG_09200 [Acidimicrobiia bacterium]